MTAYYNEHDPKAAAWLRELIKQGHIADGEVDERSISDVSPDELAKFTQCHFFAGIGGWSHALRLAGWPDARPVWTGSCPCQPFSVAGKGKGVADERHLWPAFFHLIEQCAPAIVFGEQVASKDGLNWLDLVQADMEGAGYAFAAADLCAAGVGAPHWRQRLYFVGSAREIQSGREYGLQPQGGGTGRMADTDCRERDGIAELRGHVCNREDARRPEGIRGATTCSTTGRMADADHTGPQRRGERRNGADEWTAGPGGVAGNRADPLDGFWGGADWIGCTDGKFRPVEPGTQPLANGIPGRVGLLRGYGNAIVPQVAAAFVEAACDF